MCISSVHAHIFCICVSSVYAHIFCICETLVYAQLMYMHSDADASNLGQMFTKGVGLQS